MPNNTQNNNAPVQSQNKTNTMAIVGFVLAFLIPLAGFIISIISLGQIKKKDEGGKGLAIAGIILSSVFMLIGLLIMVSAISNVNNAVNNISENNNTNSSSTDKNKTYRFDDRADKQSKDVEIVPGESGTVDGRKLTVLSVEKRTSLGEYQNAPSGKVYLVVSVNIENVSDRAVSYNPYDFRLQTASGQVIDPYYGGDNQLSSGDLVQGGKVSGNVTFEAPVETANQYIIYKPNSIMSDRIIVQVAP